MPDNLLWVRSGEPWLARWDLLLLHNPLLQPAGQEGRVRWGQDLAVTGADSYLTGFCAALPGLPSPLTPFSYSNLSLTPFPYPDLSLTRFPCSDLSLALSAPTP